MINDSIKKLITYGIEHDLIDEADGVFVRNRLLSALRLPSYDEPKRRYCGVELEETLRELVDFAVESGVIEDGIASRDLFDTELMGILTPFPREVIGKFFDEYKKSPEAATEYYYKFSCDTDYIRTYRIKKDLRWVTATEYGDIDITVNLSKPEKDPKAIAAALSQKSAGYPKCLLCRENEGFSGTMTHPARQNHRIIPLALDGQRFYLQYSPYVYYNEHCIVFNEEHTPMKIDRSAFKKLLEFVTLFPHYFIGSNADLPIVGGSILTHDHFQGGHYQFAMERAPIEKKIEFDGYSDIDAGIVKWPLSAIRLTAADRSRIVELADKILAKWRGYTDKSAFIFAETDGTPHNTVTPIARRRGKLYELDLVLRNNITTEEHPLGVFHPHAELHHIKKENIGLIEVMGLAVLPSRLKAEMKKLSDYLVSGGDYRADEATAKHADWADEIKKNHPELSADNVDAIIEREIGLVFARVLEDAGVYKCSAEGIEAFLRFISYVNANR